MARKFDIGRQNEILMNATHYDIYKVMQLYLSHPENLDRGPVVVDDSDTDIINGALWLDKYSSSTNADLKYFSNGAWKLLFADRFKLLQHLLDPEEPTDPIEGQLWINSNGALTYYHNGQFQVIKAYITSEDEESNLQYEDFLIITPVKSAEYAVINNFTKFMFSHTPIEEWHEGEKYYYQQGVTVDHILYVCNKEHYSTNETNPVTNAYYWTRMDTLLQFLVPNSYTDKIFINGKFIHEKVNEILDEIESLLYKSFAITFEYEDDSVLHDSLRFDIPGDKGYYDTAILVLPEDDNDTSNPDLVIPDKEIEEEEGYIRNTNVSVYIPIDQVELDEDDIITEEDYYETNDTHRLVTAVHVNPKRINKIEKYFLELDKTTRVINLPKEDTEFYGIKDGIGKLLIESNEDFAYDYCGYMQNGIECIKVSQRVAKKYDYIYAIHYEFSSYVKKPGVLYRKRVKLNDQHSIYVGKVNPNQICVFAQGLYYQQDEDTYEYNFDDEYIYLKEKMIDEVTNERLEVSVLKFPTIHKGKLKLEKYIDDNFIEGRGYRVDLNAIPVNPNNCLGFISGIQVNPKEDFCFYDDDITAIYFPNFTREYVEEHGGEIIWILAETDKVENGEITHSMFRGRTKAESVGNGVGISITRDKNMAADDILFLDYMETPIFFVDGLLMSQSDLDIQENYITIKKLTVGQDVIMLADTNSKYSLDDIIEKSEVLVNLQKFDPENALEEDETRKKLIEDIKTADDYVDILNSYVYEDFRYIHSIYNFNVLLESNSDSLLFQDNAANITISTELNDSTVLYLRNGLICDTSSVLVSKVPTSGYDGEIKHVVNAVQDKWIKYNSRTGIWTDIDEATATLIALNCNGYFSTNKNISIIQDLNGQKYCTYFAYLYSDTVEYKLLTGYCDADSNTGTKDGLNPYTLNYKHNYCPGRNELTVYVNGIRQNLTSPYDTNYEDSFVKECPINGSNTFMLSIDDGSTNGKALDAAEGYYTYKIKESDSIRFEYLKEKMSDEDFNSYESIELVSEPNENTIFYVVEPTESNETSACQRNVLTFKDSLSSKGAYVNSIYQSKDINLSKGNIRVFINGIRQPYGTYKDLEGNAHAAYKIINSNTLQIQEPLIGGFGLNEGNESNPLFKINQVDGKQYYKVLDEILIETRTDYNLREITIPLEQGKIEFTTKDGLPEDLFKTKDTILIYINGLAYGNEYTNQYGILTLNNTKIQDFIDDNYNNVITFEWR